MKKIMKISLLLIILLAESAHLSPKVYKKCHLQYHEKDDVCSLDPPTVSQIGPKTILDCAVLCSTSEASMESKLKQIETIERTNSCVAFNYHFATKTCDLFEFREKFKVWKSKWSNVSCVFYQGNMSNGSRGCSLSEFKDFVDIPGFATEDDGIYIVNVTGPILPIYCQFYPMNVVYLVFQRRMDGSVDFWRTWKEYEDGFGNLQTEFWLGNRHIHRITSQRPFKLRIDMESFNRRQAFAEYGNFSLGSAESNFTLHIGGYSGTAGDFLSRMNLVPFTTKDSDHDTFASNCAVKFLGAWWYTNCHSSNLNGFYGGPNATEYAVGIVWGAFTGFYTSLKYVDMKITRNFIY